MILIDCICFWNIFGTTNKSTKSGPPDPVFITKVLQKYTKDIGASSEILFSYLRIWHFDFRGRSVYLAFWKFGNRKFENESWELNHLKIWNLETWTFEIGNVQIGVSNFNFYCPKLWLFEIFEKLTSRKWAPEHDEDSRTKFFKIFDMHFISIKKHEMGIW